MSAARELLQQLLERRDLSQVQAEALLAQLTDPMIPPAMAGALLAALSTKGVVAQELLGLALAMRRRARPTGIPAKLRAIDIVGTGGDASGSFNISTGTALLTAACGVPVIKHGNRSVSSRCGSADMLEALGVGIAAGAEAAAACLAATGFTFLYAPHYHPATAGVAPVRAALGVRTVFNILGPLVNPAQPALHLVGAFSLNVARLMADTFAGLPIERTFVVHGAEGWDEPTPIGPFTVFDVRPGRVDAGLRSPADYGLNACTAADLAGGDAHCNARALQAVLLGEDRGAHRDCLLLGTALALERAAAAQAPRGGGGGRGPPSTAAPRGGSWRHCANSARHRRLRSSPGDGVPRGHGSRQPRARAAGETGLLARHARASGPKRTRASPIAAPQQRL